MSIENGRGGWIRTNAWQDQNLLPYRLATPLYLLQTYTLHALHQKLKKALQSNSLCNAGA